MKCAKTGKLRHPTKGGACVAAKRLKSNRINVFPCAACKGWHIGNSNDPFRLQQRIDQILARDERRARAALNEGAMS